MIKENAQICNIGIGAGYWDRYLLYKLKGGSLYYQTLDKNEMMGDFLKVCSSYQMTVENYLLDESYGYKAQYWKVIK